jgi:ABC transporter, substrate-binding protein, aliphatic sulfonates family
MNIRRSLSLAAAAVAAALALSACVAGEGSSTQAQGGRDSGWSKDTLNLDWATYSPLSIIVKEKGWIEKTLGDGVTVTWLQSAGSNKANEALRADAVDVGSTAGSAALLARANGSPIRTIALYSQPEWAALVVPADSDITDVAGLRGKRVAATKGTDPYFFLLQSLQEHGVGLDEVTVENLQHADGRTALESGAVDAWSGLDPLMATSEIEAGSRLVYRNIDFNTWGFLNATEDFVTKHADLAQVVVDAYEKARRYALENRDETVALLAEAAGISTEVAEKVIKERTNLDISIVPGATQRAVLEVVGPIFVESNDVASQADIDTALEELFEPSFAEKADPSRIAE